MNSGSYALEPISQDGVLVTIALGLVAALAILTVVAMLWGARLKRARKAAEQEEQHRIEELKAEGVETTNGTGDRATPALRAHHPAPSDAAAGDAGHDRPPAQEAPAERAPLADEPIAAAAPLDATPASVAADPPTGDAGDADGAQPVTVLKGLGPKIAARLNELGITRIDQLAWLDDAEAEDLDRQLGAFQGRMQQDRWREQARLLACGDRTAYEAQFGRLG